MNFNIPITESNDLDIRKSPHILVSGITGSAKSTVLMGLNLHFMTSKTANDSMVGMSAKTFFIDPKRSDISHLSDYLVNGDKRVVSTPTMAAKLLRVLVANMEARYTYFHGEFGKDFSSFKKDGKIFRPVFVTIDELSALLLETKTRAEILNRLTKLVLLGRQSGFFVITGIQRPESSVFPRQISLEYNTRILLKANSADNDTLRMLFPMIEPKKLPQTIGGPGNGLIYQEGLDWLVPRPIQFPDYFKLDIPELVQQIENNINPDLFIDESDYWQTI